MVTTDATPGGEEGGEGLRRAGQTAWSLLGIFALVAIGGWLLYQVRSLFPPLVLALAIIFLLNPFVSRLEKRKVPRLWGTLAIYLLFIVAMAAIVTALSGPLGAQMSILAQEAGQLGRDASALALSLADRFDINLDATLVQDAAGSLQDAIRVGGQGLLDFTAGTIHVFVIFVLAPFIALYLLIDLPKLQASFVRNLPPRFRDEWLGLLEQCGQTLGSFFRGQLLVAAIVGAMASIVLLILKVPFWLPLGLLVGFFNLIPLVGPFIGGGAASLVAMITSGRVTQGLLVAGLMLGIQQIDNHFISPSIMGRAVNLHPVAIILALLAGASLGGLFGMLLSVPATAVGKIFTMHYYRRHVLLPGPVEPEPPPEEPPQMSE